MIATKVLNGKLIELCEMCPDCGGTGCLGIHTDGRKISCERCGGHEDSLGTGKISKE